MLATSMEEDNVLAAFRAGARAYILKTIPASELGDVLRTVYSGETYVPPAVARTLVSEVTGESSGPPSATSALDSLSDREREILERVAAGLSNKEIGQELHLAEKTIKHYVTNILRKLGVRNRVEAAALLARDPGHKERLL